MDHLEADTSTKSSASGFVCDVNTEKHIGARAACFFDNTCHLNSACLFAALRPNWTRKCGYMWVCLKMGCP